MSTRSSRTIAIVALFATALLAGCGAKEKPAEPVRPVQLTQVKLGGANATAVFAGDVKPRYEADLGFRIAGKIVARYADVGARVKKGQALARLDPADVGLQAEAAKAQVAATETEWKFAQAEYDRYAGLLKEKFISASALDAKRNTLDANRAKYQQAKANLAVAQNQAGYATLTASDDGVITAVNADAGQVVTAGQPVFRLARAEEREVAISVPENRIGELTAAKQLFVVLWANPQKMYAAKVREVSPSVDATTRTFAVRVAIANPDPAVQWGMTANVGVQGDSAADTAILPPMSIYQQDGKPAVWRFDPATKQVNLTPVSIQQYREDGVVASGVRDGDWIVASGVHKLLPGQIVRPYDEGPTNVSPEAALPAATSARR